jgi:hypothetical protein
VKVRRKYQKFYTFRSDDYPNIILYVVKAYLNVVTEGPPQSFFDQSTGNDATIVEAVDELVPNMPPGTNHHNEDIQAFTVLSAIVEDDNLPVPENIPPPNEPPVRPGASKGCIPCRWMGLPGYLPSKLEQRWSC